jgi:hypothetical protein
MFVCQIFNSSNLCEVLTKISNLPRNEILKKIFFLLNYEYFKIRPSEQAHSPLPTLRFMSTFSRRSIKDVF